MTNQDKNELRQLAKEGLSFEAIRRIVNCSDTTIKQYLKIFKNNEKQKI
jgi:IS30 family transposase